MLITVRSQSHFEALTITTLATIYNSQLDIFKPETKTKRLPKDRKTKHVRAATPSPAKATEGTSASNERPDQADQELTRLASHYTSQLDHMTIEEIRQQAGVETSGENLESSPEK